MLLGYAKPICAFSVQMYLINSQTEIISRSVSHYGTKYIHFCTYGLKHVFRFKHVDRVLAMIAVISNGEALLS